MRNNLNYKQINLKRHKKLMIVLKLKLNFEIFNKNTISEKINEID